MRSGQYRLEIRACQAACGPPAVQNFTVLLPTVPAAAPTNLGVRNERAHALYASEGFVEEGRLREAVRTAEGYDTLIVMSLLDREHAGLPAV